MPNNDLISRADVLDLVQSYGPATYDMPYGSGDMIIRPEDVMALPASDAALVIHGRWIDREIYESTPKMIDRWQSARCTKCKRYHTTPYMYYFTIFQNCPNCGAKMDGGDNDDA